MGLVVKVKLLVSFGSIVRNVRKEMASALCSSFVVFVFMLLLNTPVGAGSVSVAAQ